MFQEINIVNTNNQQNFYH